ncbi:MAG TPA: hypothetical protein ENK52_03480 [Saprospiraceae bacterium]|nr:hypothetical protein [Saprospiraceae bacterium]
MSCLIIVSFFTQCNPTKQAISTTNQKTKLEKFPHSWLGEWKGNLDIFGAEGKKQSIAMQLHILPIENTDRFSWDIIYGKDIEKGKRAYELLTIDATKGFYSIDEKNSINIECYFFKDKLFSRYDVMNNLLLVTYEKHGDELIFEVISGKHNEVSTTGNTTDKGEEIPAVKTYPIGVMQRAVLQRAASKK